MYILPAFLNRLFLLFFSTQHFFFTHIESEENLYCLRLYYQILSLMPREHFDF